MINLTPLFQALIALFAAIITYKVIPWIEERTTKAQRENLRAAVRVAVFAAEQLYGAGEGTKKFNYVKLALEEKGFTVDTDEIEACVRQYLPAHTPKDDGEPVL